MASKWRTARVEEIAERVAMGPFGSSIKVETFVPEGVPVISGQHLHGYRIDDKAGFRFITEDHADRLRNANVQRGDIVLTHRGNIGQVAIIPEDSEFERYVVSQSQFYLRCDRAKIVPEFLLAYLKSPEGQHKLLANVSQVGVPSIAQPVTYLRKIAVPLPPIAEQRVIAEILVSIERKIDLNRRMSDELETIARTIFNAWFVDFSPVRAKAEGRDSGLPNELADVFPERFVDSQDGNIPRGWTRATIRDFSSLNSETWSRDTRPATINYLDLSNAKWGRIESISVYGQREAPSRAQRVLRRGDTIVGTVRPGNGSYALVSEDGLTGSTGFAVLRPTNKHYQEFVYLGATASASIEELSRLADGAAYPAVRPEVVAARPIINPGDHVLERFSQVVGPLLAQVSNNERECRALVGLRAELLPRMVSGRTRVLHSGGRNEAE